MQCVWPLPGCITSRVRKNAKDMVAPPNVRISLAAFVGGVLGEENGSTRPVLKHGPESLTCMPACGCVRLLCTMKVAAGILLACQCCSSTCSGVAVSRRTPVCRRHLRGRAKVTVFIEKKGFSKGRGSKSERATNGDPKVAGNTSENTGFARIAGIRDIRGI